MADLGRLLSEKEFGSIEEANAYLESLTLGGGQVPHPGPRSPLDQAQDLMYDAWEARRPQERVKLARKALELSADCADAYVLLAEETARSLEEACDLYSKGVAAGERAIGEHAFKQDVGHFWGILETRPYMRARAGLADCLWQIAKHREAVEHYWDMLRLNPNDNQGIRYVLLAHLLEMDDRAGLEKLFKRYRGDGAADWLYGRALYEFKKAGDSASARKLVAQAKKENRHVPAYLSGKKRLPAALPAIISPGGEDEAISSAAAQLSAWRNTPGALDWLEKSGS
ncbi:MAG: hypothetical protein M1370_04495 [Bacteroidetes bacterium]|nr:hypothetical protein [Bacteroidota bacterium]MCL5027186.1 hypothetical protein [Chloroflexota bacterium]